MEADAAGNGSARSAAAAAYAARAVVYDGTQPQPSGVDAAPAIGGGRGAVDTELDRALPAAAASSRAVLPPPSLLTRSTRGRHPPLPRPPPVPPSTAACPSPSAGCSRLSEREREGPGREREGGT
uniref:Uncharacterized protein n=1 Tax=Oryza nivara TaxID=4536 RepID=A0A0E0IAH6_ORYNI